MEVSNDLIIEKFLELHDFLKDPNVIFVKNGIKDIFQEYVFIYTNERATLKEEEEQSIKQNLNESSIIIIDQNQALKKCLVIGFEKTIILYEISTTTPTFLSKLLSSNSKLPICILPNAKYLIEKAKEIQNPIIEADGFFMEENMNLTTYFNTIKIINLRNKVLPLITPCITGYLIKDSYSKLNKNRIEKFNSKKEEMHEEISENDYVELRYIGSGSSSQCFLIYHIKRRELLIIKKLYENNEEEEKLFQREFSNYMILHYPFFPKFYGRVQNKNWIVIEFINGQKLFNIKNIHLDKKDIPKIIIELVLIFNFFQEIDMIYRDLKPNNVMIDENKTIVLIDFDRLIKNDCNTTKTSDLNQFFIVPEIEIGGEYSYKSDIYSLGKMIEYIIIETKIDEYPIIKQIIKECTDEKAMNRPSTSTVIQYLNSSFHLLFENYKNFINNSKTSLELENKTSKIDNYKDNHTKIINNSLLNQDSIQQQSKRNIINNDCKNNLNGIDKLIHYYSISANQNDSKAQYNLGLIYYEGQYIRQDINKALHYFLLASNQNDSEAQFNLGFIYNEGKYIACDINKAIHYYSLAANQNHSGAQFNLGLIYYEGKSVMQDINKALHYFLLASNQNDSEAQFNLGFIYNEGKYIACDINKAIHYYSLAANQNHSGAQLNLGIIYYEGKSVMQDINKALHYFLLASNQNNSSAQLYLGFIYNEGKCVIRDIYKAIHYYSLAAGQNHPKAQFYLGVIYHDDIYVARDINKAIHYYSLAAGQNHSKAQFNLGFIYEEGKYVPRDINKAIYYYILASNQSDSDAQYNLGVIYVEGKYIKRNIYKAIYYFSLASNQGDSNAQYNLGIIYLNKGIFQDIKKGRFYIMFSSKNENREANFAHGFLLHEGKIIKKNIEEAIHYYKEASSFNNQYAKNNLGIIYKHGYNKNKGESGRAIVYFQEAIRQKNDYLSMYNLAHIYVYDETFRGGVEKAIELLIRSLSMNKLSLSVLYHSIVLLSLALLKQFDFNNNINTNINAIKKQISQRVEIPSDVTNKIYYIIHTFALYDKLFYEFCYELYRKKDFVYDILRQPVFTSNLDRTNRSDKPPKYPKAKDISSEFYDGFGKDLLN
ncbi:hypothetical protein M9Y10_033055 [Tritrichomonas musculus]|uniref:Protein kinase domain-containing protein n=1 Tax=Tritrichomonas musculus TaxID=1915356 RepID=A0ABR2GWY8_9EUKA